MFFYKKAVAIWVWVLLAAGAVHNVNALDFSGTCTGTVPAAGSPHQLIGFCTVPLGGTFTIESGAELVGNFNTLSVAGTLDADNATLMNVLLSYTATGDGTFANSTFTYTSSGCPVNIVDASPTLSNNVFDFTSSARVCIGRRRDRGRRRAAPEVVAALVRFGFATLGSNSSGLTAGASNR